MAPLHSFTSRENVEAGLRRVSKELRQRASALPKMIKVDISKVTDWQRRATRLSIALVFFGLMGHCLPFPPEDHNFASNFRQSCNWAAITCIVVTAPLIGKVSQVAFDRLLGTAVGGLIGYLCFTGGFYFFGVMGGGVFISLMSGATAWATTYLAFRTALDQLARFVQLTYCIVAFGAKPDKGAFVLAMLRVGGIFFGGLFSVLLAVVVLPRSASIESLREMKKALKALYDLNQEVWAMSGIMGGNPATRRAARKPHRHGYSALQLRMDSRGREEAAAAASFSSPSGAAASLHPSASDSDLPLKPSGASAAAGRDELRRLGWHDLSVDHLDLLVQRDEERDSRQAVIEKLFTTVYTTLARVDDNLAQTNSEIYIWHFWGRYFFLPGVHWFPVKSKWQVPKKDLEDLAVCLRRVARMLWTLLLDFEEGFGSEMESVLQLYYPKQLISELANYQARAILDLLRAFPGGDSIEVDNLFTLGQVTDCLLQISDARARTTVFNVKRKRTAAAGMGAAAAAGGLEKSLRPSRQSLANDARRSSDLRARGASVDAATATAAATAVPVNIEKEPLLSPLPPTADGAGATAAARLLSAASGFAAAVLASTGSAQADSGSTAAAAGCGGGGVFTSRLLSGHPDGRVSLHLPPRRYLQEHQERELQRELEREQQLQQRRAEGQSSSEVPAAAPPTAPAGEAAVAAGAGGAEVQLVATERSEVVDTFGDLRFESLAIAPRADGSATSAGSAGAASVRPPRPPPSGLGGEGGPGGGGNPAAPAALTSAAPAAAAPRPSPAVPPAYASPFSSFACMSRAEPAAYGRASLESADLAAAPGSGRHMSVSKATTSPPPADGAAAVRAAAAGVLDGGDRLAGLSSMLSTMLVEPVTFPPTEEGYLSQVRWYSFQFVMDEMVNELEEAFHACSAVLQKLPYPVGS